MNHRLRTHIQMFENLWVEREISKALSNPEIKNLTLLNVLVIPLNLIMKSSLD
jgi:hypothetical protein